MRILGLDASPKKVSDTMRATSMFVKGIEDLNQGDVIEVVKLINCEIKPCPIFGRIIDQYKKFFIEISR